MASFASAVQTTVVTRERVVAPPDRFISVTDGELLTYFKSKLILHALFFHLPNRQPLLSSTATARFSHFFFHTTTFSFFSSTQALSQWVTRLH